MSSDHRLTVIIPTRNRARLAAELVACLRGQMLWTCPILVIDQSDDGGRELAALLRSASFPDVEHIPQQGRGTGRARNEGARRAQTPWLLFLDDDVIPAEGYAETLWRFIDDHPWVDVVAGAVQYRREWELYCSDRRAWRDRFLDARRPRRRPSIHLDGVQWFLEHPRAPYPVPAIGFGAGNVAIQHRAFFGAGGFDEQIEASGDDREFALRLWWYGYRTGTCPAAVVFHMKSPEGGRRSASPDRPEPGSVYYYLKWFPRRLLFFSLLIRWTRRPWVIPVKLFQLLRAYRAAQRRLQAGPVYISPPVPRPVAMPEPPDV